MKGESRAQQHHVDIWNMKYTRICINPPCSTVEVLFLPEHIRQGLCNGQGNCQPPSPCTPNPNRCEDLDMLAKPPSGLPFCGSPSQTKWGKVRTPNIRGQSPASQVPHMPFKQKQQPHTQSVIEQTNRTSCSEG